MTWKKESGFVWAMMGSAIGFANLLSFSAQCYKNGGGAFLIPFVVAILVLGLPMLFLEGTIGHKFRLPLVSACGQVGGRIGKTLGWLAVAAVATIGAFYIVLTGYSVAFAWFSGTGTIPTDTAGFFKNTFLKDTGSVGHWGKLSWPILLSAVGVCLFSWVVLSRNIRSGVEKLCSSFLPLLCALIGLFALIVCFLPGAFEGFRYFLKPDFSRLSDPTLWRDVFGQVFFSFSLGLGIVTAYSRHSEGSTSIPRVMWYVAMGDLVVSLVAGFAIFGCVGYLSQTTGTPIPDIVSSDSSFEMGFVIFPRILAAFGPILSQVVGVVFFACVFIAGITGVFSIMESILSNIQVEFNRSRRSSAALTTLLLAALSLLFCFGNGQHIIGALAPMVLGNNMLIGGLAEILLFLYIAKSLRGEPIWQSHRLTYYALRTLIPFILLTILAGSILGELREAPTLATAIRWSWLAGALLLSALFSLRNSEEPVLAQ